MHIFTCPSLANLTVYSDNTAGNIEPFFVLFNVLRIPPRLAEWTREREKKALAVVRLLVFAIDSQHGD